MTPREVSYMIQGVAWRAEHQHRDLKRQAWLIAALTRMDKFPKSLAAFMRERKPAERQDDEQQRAFFHEFADRAGLKVEVHAKPILSYPVIPGTVCSG